MFVQMYVMFDIDVERNVRILRQSIVRFINNAWKVCSTI